MLVCGLASFAYSAAKKYKPSGVTDLYAEVPLDERLLQLDKKALDEAYHQHVLLLFSVWLKDQAGDPGRFNNGMKIARRAYQQARDSIAKMEKALRSLGAPTN